MRPTGSFVMSAYVATSGRKIDRPEDSSPGVERTLNATGFTINSLDEVSREFVRFAAGVAPERVLDVGAGFGVATLAALEAGASVIANDMEAGHLAHVESRCPASFRSRLTLSPERFPDEVALEPGSIAGVLLSRVLHFFSGPEVERSAATVAGWLRPGGRVFVVCESSLFLEDARLRRVFQQQRSRGERWPGFVRGVHDLLPHRAHFVPDQLHYLDPPTLREVFESRGFEIETAGHFRRNVPEPGARGSGGHRVRTCVKLIARRH